ncbi:MAG: hypothetical protein ACODAJ_17350 [Planctomycetota bacterium]
MAKHRRIRPAASLLFLVGLLAVCFHRVVARALLTLLKPPMPTHIYTPTQHPAHRYAAYALYTGFALILCSLLVVVIGTLLAGGWWPESRQSDGDPDGPTDRETHQP